MRTLFVIALVVALGSGASEARAQVVAAPGMMAPLTPELRALGSPVVAALGNPVVAGATDGGLRFSTGNVPGWGGYAGPGYYGLPMTRPGTNVPGWGGYAGPGYYGLPMTRPGTNVAGWGGYAGPGFYGLPMTGGLPMAGAAGRTFARGATVGGYGPVTPRLFGNGMSGAAGRFGTGYGQGQGYGYGIMRRGY